MAEGRYGQHRRRLRDGAAVFRLHRPGGGRLQADRGGLDRVSRALAEGLFRQQSDAEFNAALGGNIDKIYQAASLGKSLDAFSNDVE